LNIKTLQKKINFSNQIIILNKKDENDSQSQVIGLCKFEKLTDKT